MIADILVGLKGSPASERAVDVALEIARRLRASLFGLALVDEPDIRAAEATGIAGSAYKRQRDAALLADAEARAGEWIAAFELRCKQERVPAQTLARRGRPAATILSELHHHDLMVLGAGVNFRFETDERDQKTRDEILRRAGTPILLVPDCALPMGGGDVLIAYDGSLAAKRALESYAGSGLGRARLVHVVCVDDDGAVAWEKARQAAGQLHDLGLAATAHNVVSTLPIADAILEQRAKLDAGLIVMGAYVRARVLRLLWGSVTDELLAKVTVPVFLHY
jgi:nucleotide-binding universal stress UspA family protein